MSAKKAKQRREQLLKDAAKHGISIGPLKLNRCGANWTIDGDTIRPGFEQIPGIGPSITSAILAARDSAGGFRSWKDLLRIKGIGPKKMALVQEFCNNPDPFSLLVLGEALEEARRWLATGVRLSAPDSPWDDYLPQPTHTSADVPYERGDDEMVLWVGMVKDRNLKDLFENHHSRTGQILDPNDVRRPDLNEWVVMLCEDDTDLLTCTINRYKYPSFKEAVWSIDPSKDLVMFRGVKPGSQARRAIYVSEMWNLSDYMEAVADGNDGDPDDDEEDG